MVARHGLRERVVVAPVDGHGVPAFRFGQLPGWSFAQVAFLYGRADGHWEAGKIEQIELPDANGLVAEIAANEDLGVQLDELRDIVQETVDQVV